MNSRVRVLDTDTLSLVQRHHPSVTNRLKSPPESQVAITSVTVEEQMRGWLSQLHRERKLERLILTYARFPTVVLAFSEILILPFDHDAAEYFQRQMAAVRRAILNRELITAIYYSPSFNCKYFS